jgi:hypothetical protein
MSERYGLLRHSESRFLKILVAEHSYIVTCSCSATNKCGFFDRLHRFIGSLLNICNYTELPHIKAFNSTQPILTLSYTVYLQ